MPSGLSETQVVIVGGGPVGLTFALDLGRRGPKTDPRALEREVRATGAPLDVFELAHEQPRELWLRSGPGAAPICTSCGAEIVCPQTHPRWRAG